MSDKGLGQKIAIKFTQDIITLDLSINTTAFTISAQEFFSPLEKDKYVTMFYPILSITRHPDSPTNTIVLTFNNFNRFNNVEGDILISYDSAKGNLAGTGGYTESFEVIFEPEDLYKELETLTILATAEVDFIKVYHTQQNYRDIYFEISASAEVSHVDLTIVNP